MPKAGKQRPKDTQRPVDANALPDALAALASTRDRTMAAMDDSRSALETAQDTVDRARKTLRERPGIAETEPVEAEQPSTEANPAEVQLTGDDPR